MDSFMTLVRGLDWSPLWISLKTGIVATILCFFLGIWAARKIMQLRPSVKAVVDGILTLPMVLPPTVAGFFLEEARARHRLGGLRLDAGAQAALLAYAWPGNVRELEHTIGRAVIRALADLPARHRILSLGAADLDLAVPPRRAGDAPAGEGVADERDTSSAGPLDLDYRQAVSAFETGLIERALQQHQGNWAAAARSLHVDRANLARMARRLGIAPRP